MLVRARGIANRISPSLVPRPLFPQLGMDYITAMWKELDQFGSGQGQFNKPFSVIVGQRDRLIVADHWNHRVVLLDEAGTWLSTIEDNDHPFKYPYGLGSSREHPCCSLWF